MNRYFVRQIFDEMPDVKIDMPVFNDQLGPEREAIELFDRGVELARRWKKNVEISLWKKNEDGKPELIRLTQVKS